MWMNEANCHVDIWYLIINVQSHITIVNFYINMDWTIQILPCWYNLFSIWAWRAHKKFISYRIASVSRNMSVCKWNLCMWWTPPPLDDFAWVETIIFTRDVIIQMTPINYLMIFLFDKLILLIIYKYNTILTTNENKRWDFHPSSVVP